MEQRKQLILCALGLGLLMIVCGIFLPGVLRIIALAVLYFVLLEVVMTILHPKQPKLSKEEKIKAEDQWYFDRQDPGKLYDLRRVGTVMHVVAIVLSVMAIFRGPGNPLWGMLCMGCHLITVALCIIHPAYFALCHGEKERNRAHHFPIVNLIIPYVLPLFASAMSYELVIAVVDWLRAAEIALLVGAVIGMVLRFLAPECRRNTGNWVMALFMTCICAFGFVMPLNQMLEKEESMVMSGVVMDYDGGGRHSSAKYEVLLDSGEQVDIPVNRHFYDEGDQVELEHHTGGLGIEYYTYAD